MTAKVPALMIRRRQLLVGAASAAVASTLPPFAYAAESNGKGYQVLDWPKGLPTPALNTTYLDGRPVKLADFRGKVVLLNFWASWCAPCRAEMPTLQALPELVGEDKLIVLALNFKEASRTARRFLQASQLKLPVLMDPLGEHTEAWKVSAFPTTVLIDRHGVARQLVRGEVDWSSAEALGWVDRLLSLP